MIISFLLICFLTGCETTPSTPAPVSNLDTVDSKKIATWLQKQDSGRLATLGGGQSMEPLFLEDTIILLAPIAFEDLEVDMVVAYRNAEGTIVVHSLFRKDSDGWLAKGLNNPYIDPEKVREDNLIGVVYGTLFGNGK